MSTKTQEQWKEAIYFFVVIMFGCETHSKEKFLCGTKITFFLTPIVETICKSKIHLKHKRCSEHF